MNNQQTVHLYAPDTGRWVTSMNGSFEYDTRPVIKRSFPDVRTARYVSRILRKEEGVVTHVVLL